ncbi:MAG: E3 ubiquitin-protein ligase MARCH5 [Sylvanvirus sp.]|uniref:E3 ubiquitin-protein ligase MARCH5 n=1 Tax=Sylvanvirus sp. TaxID=2487774 RepID=A0A3G5AJH2_9VIRU|nr:MAG: E3 ubiquitin-protein ligase MARCH5 [Sylvanvirus sp.]
MNDESDDSVLTCRICFESEESVESGRLFSPCKCRGTQRYIHVGCLDQWRRTSTNTNAAWHCGTCLYQYQFGRMGFATFISHPWTCAVCTFLLVTGSVLIVAYFIKFFLWICAGMKLSKSMFALPGHILWWSMVVIGTLTMLVMLFISLLEQNNDHPMRLPVPQLNVDLLGNLIHHGNNPVHPYQLEYLIEFLGYTFSVCGFMSFIRFCYLLVNTKVQLFLSSCGIYVLSVES